MKISLTRRVALGVFLAGCIGLGIGPARASAGGQPQNLATQGNNAFTFDLYGRVQVQDGGQGNLFFSPYSISSALSMLYVGARGQTAHEMRATLKIPILPEQQLPRQGAEQNDLAVADAYAALNNRLSGDWNAQGFSLTVANGLWGQTGEPFLPDYLDLVKKDFGGALTPVDFITQPDAVRQQINQWIADKTHDKIKDMLSPGTVTPDDRLVLANAIYFKGAWMDPFDAKDTAKGDFHTQHGDVVQADMMHRQDRLGYVEDDNCQMVELPYNGGQLAMLVLLPKPDKSHSQEEGKPDPAKDGMLRLESALTPDYLANLVGKLAARTVDLTLPKWETSQSISLGEMLESMGMKQAFTSSADFSGINGRKDLSVSEVIHRAWVSVDENGTEAAGATAIVMMGAAVHAPPPPASFTADHPFVYFILHQPTNTILFAGRLCDPTAGK